MNEMDDRKREYTITIPVCEYEKLVRTDERVHIFEAFVKASEFRPGREECAAILGFELETAEEETANDELPM